MEEPEALKLAATRQAIWDRLYGVATEILAKHDPVGLIELGCPRDEYSDVGREAINRLVLGASLTDGITRAYRDWYTLEPEASRVESAAIEIADSCSEDAATLRRTRQ